MEYEESEALVGNWSKSVSRVAKVLFVLALLAGGALALLSRSMEPRHMERYVERDTTPPKHDVIYGEPGVSIGENVKVAAHHADVDDKHLTWRSTLLVRGNRDEPEGAIGFARPLAQEMTLVSSQPSGASFQRNAEGDVVAIKPPPAPEDGLRLTFITRQERDGDSSFQPPLIGNHVAQRITISGAYYEVGERTDLTHYVIFRATEYVSYEQIQWTDEQLGEPPSHNGVPIYVRSAGLSGRLIPRLGVWIFFVFLALAAAAGAALFILRRRRRASTSSTH